MDFGFSQEQELLRATARKFLENECTSGSSGRAWRSRRA